MREITARVDRFLHEAEWNAGELQVELEAGDAVLGAAQFEIHVAVVILGAEDIVEHQITLQVVLLIIISDETDRDTGDRRLERNARVEEGENAAANGGH